MSGQEADDLISEKTAGLSNRRVCGSHARTFLCWIFGLRHIRQPPTLDGLVRKSFERGSVNACSVCSCATLNTGAKPLVGFSYRENLPRDQPQACRILCEGRRIGGRYPTCRFDPLTYGGNANRFFDTFGPMLLKRCFNSKANKVFVNCGRPFGRELLICGAQRERHSLSTELCLDRVICRSLPLKELGHPITSVAFGKLPCTFLALFPCMPVGS